VYSVQPKSNDLRRQPRSGQDQGCCYHARIVRHESPAAGSDTRSCESIHRDKDKPFGKDAVGLILMSAKGVSENVGHKSR